MTGHRSRWSTAQCPAAPLIEIEFPVEAQSGAERAPGLSEDCRRSLFHLLDRDGQSLACCVVSREDAWHALGAR